MPEILVLSEDTIDKIAAGEVVERPLNVVKELVENSMDAGAHAITVEIKNGGIDLIRVTDDGEGIPADQVKTAFFRHATSKIRNMQDLSHLSSMGFRGEALSSIAAVAQVELVTCTEDSLTGTRYEIEGAAEKAFEQVGAPKGTTILVRNLFFNVPVRRKFLKQPPTEAGYVAEVMEQLAMSRPDISFKYVQNGQVKFYTSGNGELKEVIYRIYGREITEHLLPIDVTEGEIQIRGFLGKPEINRSNRGFEHYFLNSRYLKSRVLSKAIEDGYKQYVMQHKFPFVVLHFAMPAQAVDVNVHPSKMEVRFEQEQLVYQTVVKAIIERLRSREFIVDHSFGKEEPAPRSTPADRVPAHSPEPFMRSARIFDRSNDESNTDITSKEQSVGSGISEFSADNSKISIKPDEANTVGRETGNHEEKDGLKFLNGSDEKDGQKINGSDEKDGQESNGSDEKDGLESNGSVEKDGLEFEFDFDQPTEADEGSSAVAEPSIADIYGKSDQSEQTMNFAQATAPPLPDLGIEKAEQETLFTPEFLTEKSRESYEIIGQIFKTYWIIAYSDRIYMIDQHAAHEKVKYERLVKAMREKNVSTQMLMPPQVVHVSAREEQVLTQHLNAFEALGFEIEGFGEHAFVIRGVPVDLYGCSYQQLFEEVLDELTRGPVQGNFEVVKDKLASMACKSAVKGNMSMSRPELEALIDELLSLENPYFCPHGRPVIISMTKQEIEKKFKRIV
ncbi:MAG: DNA mismatch repair endonuclease MutL [Lachnospiraceae bacterium]|nr:DNA mismatch repair endonuclease MutL [Lachnospiraceae bacterium]